MGLKYALEIFSFIICLSQCFSGCQEGKFGRQCQLTCNCDQACNSTNGYCAGECNTAWSGPSCQKQNIALHKKANQSSYYDKLNYKPSFAVDGNTSQILEPNGTCIHTKSYSTLAWWRVNLGAIVPIKSVRIYDRTNVGEMQRMNGFKIYISNDTETPTLGNICYTRTKPLPMIPDERIYDQNCTETGRYLLIYISTGGISILDFCEVEVYVCSSGTYGENCEYQCGHCLNSKCNQADGTCSSDCEKGWEGNRCDTACTVGRYGNNCVNECGHCFKNSSCDRFNGSCSAGCRPGYAPPLCNTECPNTTYGMNCKFNCGHCLNNSICEKATGRCAHGCSIGYQTMFCNQTCGNNTYGDKCKNVCGNCYNGKQCNHINGHCTNGCDPGYYPPFCNKACGNNTYGDKCKNVCGNCYNGKQCNHINGHCTNGCDPGYYPPFCNQVCMIGTYGQRCNQTCQNCFNDTCNPVDGFCEQCKNGWKDQACQQKITASDTLVINTTIGITIGLIALLLIIIVPCVIYLKRKRNQPNAGSSDIGNDIIETSNPHCTSRNIKKKTVNLSNDKTRLYVNDFLKVDNFAINESENEETDSSLYYNMHEINRTISINKLKQYVEQKIRTGELEIEYQEIPGGQMYKCKNAEKQINKAQNRFKDTVPYDHSRVILPEHHKTDYINANYIDSVSNKKFYIATQGPKKSTVADFWMMVWDNNSGKIVMLTGLIEGSRVKCEKYWPDINESISAGNLHVTLKDEQEHSVYVIRLIEVEDIETKETRRIQQYHFTRWPDRGVPDQFQILTFHRHIHRGKNELNGPMIVHCSAGVGRTGTFIAIDALVANGRITGKVDIRGYVETMRNDRMKMIQNKRQYIFLHEVLLEAFAIENPSVQKDDFFSERIRGSIDYALIEFQKLKEMEKEYIQEDFKGSLLDENRSKNRSTDILSVEVYRPFLSTHISGRNDYINAVIVPDSCKRNGFLVTQLPLRHTVCDFWRLILDYDSRTIVCLELCEKEEEMYWPTDGDKLTFDSQLSVSAVGKPRKENGCTVHELLLQEWHGEGRCITLYDYSSCTWIQDNLIPKDLSSIFQLQDLLYRIQTSGQSSFITIQCLDGARRCGIVCAIVNIIQRMRLDGDVNIYHTVRQLQIHRPQLVSSEVQYRFCYEAIKEYLEASCLYANI